MKALDPLKFMGCSDKVKKIMKYQLRWSNNGNGAVAVKGLEIIHRIYDSNNIIETIAQLKDVCARLDI